MELKDMIISTLAELDKNEQVEKQSSPNEASLKNVSKKQLQEESEPTQEVVNLQEKEFLHSVRERVLVLFEGLQSPQNQNLDTKLDITLNFLEFLLALIEERLKGLKSSGK